MKIAVVCANGKAGLLIVMEAVERVSTLPPWYAVRISPRQSGDTERPVPSYSI